MSQERSFVLGLIVAIIFIAIITYVQPLLSNLKEPWSSYLVLLIYLSIGVTVVSLGAKKN